MTVCIVLRRPAGRTLIYTGLTEKIRTDTVRVYSGDRVLTDLSLTPLQAKDVAEIAIDEDGGGL